jgi:hypothetical protein
MIATGTTLVVGGMILTGYGFVMHELGYGKGKQDEYERQQKLTATRTREMDNFMRRISSGMPNRRTYKTVN